MVWISSFFRCCNMQQKMIQWLWFLVNISNRWKGNAMKKVKNQCCETLDMPTQGVCTGISTPPHQGHRPLSYLILFFVGFALLLFFPVLSLQGLVFRALWPLQEGIRYLYIPLMPLISIALFRSQYIWKTLFKKTSMTTRLFYGTAVLALLLCAVASFAMYSGIVNPLQLSVDPSQVGPIFYTFFTCSIWLITGLWVCSVLFCDAYSRCVPYVYFIDAFCIATLSNYVQRITAMDPIQTVETLLISTFGPISIFALLAIGGALLWFFYECYKRRRKSGIQ